MNVNFIRPDKTTADTRAVSAVPRKGETVVLGADRYVVFEVKHDFSAAGTHIITVFLDSDD